MIEVIGWIGSALLIVSLLQGRMMRLRVLNLIASLILVGYSVLVHAWPMVGMTVAVALIDTWHIVQLSRAVQTEPHGIVHHAVADEGPVLACVKTITTTAAGSGQH